MKGEIIAVCCGDLLFIMSIPVLDMLALLLIRHKMPPAVHVHFHCVTGRCLLASIGLRGHTKCYGWGKIAKEVTNRCSVSNSLVPAKQVVVSLDAAD